VSTKNKTNYLTAQYHQTATKRSNLWRNDLSELSAYNYVFHLICVMLIPGEKFQTSYILAINKTVSQ